LCEARVTLSGSFRNRITLSLWMLCSFSARFLRSLRLNPSSLTFVAAVCAAQF
jgi:hypothetical protein